MSARTETDWEDPAHEAAAEWVVRLHAFNPEALDEADWLAFEGWLNAAPGNRAAYDAAEALWGDIGRQSRVIKDLLGRSEAPTILSLPSRRSRSGPIWWAAGAAIAASMLVVVGPFSPFRTSAPTVYATAKGQQRTVILPDGTKIALNSGSQMSVLFDRGRREVNLAEGSEAAFTVVHDAGRPFVVHVGDRTVRDLGTEFDVLRNGGAVRVTVLSGEVEVDPAAGAAGAAIALHPGGELNHREGADSSSVSEVAAGEAFGWRNGQLIYRNQPLADVVADLDRYFAEPVRVEGPAQDLRFSGVLAIADESDMLRRLTALVPVSANRKDAVIVLQERAQAH